MKQAISIIFGWLLLLPVAQADTGLIDDAVLARIAMEMSAAIQSHDNNYLLKYVSAEGIVLVDRLYSKEQILDLLNDKHSWLFKRLYSGKSSIKYFFDHVQDFDVQIHQRGANAAMITYAPKKANERRPLENCYINIKDTWYLDGIFSCNSLY